MGKTVPERTGRLDVLRDALSDDDDVASELMEESSRADLPVVTIAIPTYRRPELLAEAVRSACGQDFDGRFEIIVVDNEPTSDGARLVHAVSMPSNAAARYYRNERNIGMFGNWNRCITLARGEWITILNDDDLLDSNFLTLMFAEITDQPGVDGIVSRKRIFDQRDAGYIAGPDTRQFAARGINWSKVKQLIAGGRASWGALFRGAAARMLFEHSFGWRVSRRVRPRDLFAGAMLGNGAGFVFRKVAATHIGGYYPEEFPAADYWFYLRFAKFHHLREHRATAATVRVSENESAKPETVRACFRTGYEVQHALALSDVPRWWLRFTPMLLAVHRSYHQEMWRYTLSEREIHELVGMPVPTERPRTLKIARLLLGWF